MPEQEIPVSKGASECTGRMSHHLVRFGLSQKPCLPCRTKNRTRAQRVQETTDLECVSMNSLAHQCVLFESASLWMFISLYVYIQGMQSAISLFGARLEAKPAHQPSYHRHFAEPPGRRRCPLAASAPGGEERDTRSILCMGLLGTSFCRGRKTAFA